MSFINMLMCMLTKRTNILFDENLWRKLAELAKAQKTSIGQLIREAVTEKYYQNQKLDRRMKAIESTLQNRLRFRGKIDYKELINYGRKY